MGKKVFVVNIARCNGCHNCQIACKDEHCMTSWEGYAAEQPMTGQFWGRIEETVHGSVPKVNLTYEFKLCHHCDECPLEQMAPEAVYRREDGLVIIDPIKAAGKPELANACPYGMVYLNEPLGLAQKCTGCAHLLDDGWTAPRCVDACPTEGVRFGDYEDFAEELEGIEPAVPGGHVYVLNQPKRGVGGEVYDPEEDEVIIGAKITIQGQTDGVILTTESDDFGDFWFKQVEAQNYKIWFEAEGYMSRELSIDATDKDGHIGSVPLYRL